MSGLLLTVTSGTGDMTSWSYLTFHFGGRVLSRGQLCLSSFALRVKNWHVAIVVVQQ